jgi:hypothetical protein
MLLERTIRPNQVLESVGPQLRYATASEEIM